MRGSEGRTCQFPYYYHLLTGLYQSQGQQGSAEQGATRALHEGNGGALETILAEEVAVAEGKNLDPSGDGGDVMKPAIPIIVVAGGVRVVVVVVVDAGCGV